MIAEDNPELRQYLAELLSDELNVIAVGDGQLAYEAIRAHKPDVVLSDVMMPVLDGFELVQKLKSDPALAAIPVVVLTARAGAAAAADSLDRGADDYLSKPFSPIDLRARVRAACRMKSLHDELLAAQRRAAEMEQREALRETQAALAEVSKAASLAEMAAALAHEVNQPLAGVGVNASACLRWLDRDPHDIGEAKNAAQRIARDAKRAADVVNRIRKLFAKSADVRRPLDEHVGGHSIFELGRGVDRGARPSREARERVGQRRKMRWTIARVDRIDRQARACARGLRAAISDAAERGESLGEQIDELFDGRVDAIEQLMQLRKISSFHVPVCLLGLGFEIERVGEPGLQELVYVATDSFG